MTDERAGTTAGRRYLAEAGRLVGRLAGGEWPNLDAAATLVADALARGGDIHAFGTGHSHMLAEELFYRAGGFVRVRPILFEGLMLHVDAELSTSLERLPGLAATIVEHHPMAAGDVLVVASNSGGNAVVAELAGIARARGVKVIAIVSRAHATSAAARAHGAANLGEIADVVIDNGGAPGDAAVAIEGLERRVGPTSTVVGAAALNAIVAEAAERLVARGIRPDVFLSSNMDGGDEANLRLLHQDLPR
ncbi:MAG TPA: SIS domain-containing protein [Candidatus Limnocylindrales bacterium]|nr:SIS domain-containing protein [Candidatus Limnocylindrales bacterium]